MKRFFRWGALLAAPLLLLALSASTGTKPAAGKANQVKPHTLVVENGLIHAFAQDESTIAWVDRGYKVHVRSLTVRASAIVGRTGTPVQRVAMDAVAGPRRIKRALEHLPARRQQP